MRNHLFRLAFVAFIYACLLWATFQSTFVGAPGLSFFSQIAWLNALFITCAGIGYFSSAITEEKEEDTIGLLQMAGLNHLGILFGKSTSRLIQVMLLLIVQFPFMLLSVTLGGVTSQQIIAAYVDLLAFTIMLANVALLCSVVFQRGGTAAAITTLLMVLYAIAPWYAKLQQSSLMSMGWSHAVRWQSIILTGLDWMTELSIIDQLYDVMATGFNKPFITRQVISNCSIGIVCFGLSWLLFGARANVSNPGGATRGLLAKSTNRMTFLSPGRCWKNPFIWKDFQFIGGGSLLFAAKILVYLAIFLVLCAIAATPGNWFGLTSSELGLVYFQIVLVACIIEASVYASRIFHDEVRLQTMSSLLMLPRSIPYIGYSKAIGCVLGLLPAFVSLACGSMLLPGVSQHTIVMSLIDPAKWAAFMSILVFLHLVALLSLFIKWGALPAAIFLMAPLSMCCPLVGLILVRIDQRTSASIWGELPATVTVWILTGLVCFVFQMMIAARLQELGTR